MVLNASPLTLVKQTECNILGNSPVSFEHIWQIYTIQEAKNQEMGRFSVPYSTQFAIKDILGKEFAKSVIGSPCVN